MAACDRLVWFECFDDVIGTIAAMHLKGWARARKIALIEKMNPALI